MVSVRLSLLVVCCLLYAAAAPALPIAFEQRGAGRFVVQSRDGAISLRPGRVSIGDATLHFAQSLATVRLEGVGLAARATYIGAGQSRTFPQFPKLAMRRLYPGIDAIFYGSEGRLEYDLELAPGALPSRVVLAFENAGKLSIDQDGALIAGPLRQLPPRVLQGGRQVPARYVLLGGNRAAIRIGRYDRRAPLTIDPVLQYTKYFGGSGSDSASAAATDSQGNVYIAGHSNSIDFPSTRGPSPKPIPPLLALANTGQTVTPLPIAGENSATAVGSTPDGNILYVATTGGIYYSPNGGATWRATAALPAPIIPGFTAALVVNDISVDAIDPSRAYVATTRGMFATADNGQSWSPRDYGLTANFDGTVFASSVTVSQLDHTQLYATTGRPTYLFKSTDAAGAWHILFPQAPDEPAPTVYSPNQTIFYLPPGGSDLYVVDANAIFLKSTDGGATWQRGAGALFNARILRVDPSDPSLIYVLDNYGLQKSTDGGQSFATISPPSIAGLSFSAFAYDSAARTLYLAGAGSIFVSSDQGATWQAAPVNASIIHTLQAFGGRILVGLDTPQTMFLLKSDSNGQLLSSTFFNSVPFDYITALRTDAQGAVYIAGSTPSQNFAGANKLSPPSPPGQISSFVAKIAADGASLLWYSVLGGSRSVFLQSMAVDSTGAVYIAGQTASPDFRTTANTFQASPPTSPCSRPNDQFFYGVTNLGSWAFATKISPDGANLVYSTLLTGSCGSLAQGIAVNSAGEAFVAGVTPSGDMPVSSNAFQAAFPGPLDKTAFPNAFDAGFVVRLSAAGDKVLGGTYLGGGYHSQINAVALDSAGNPVVAGSTWGITPGTTPGAYQTTLRYRCIEPVGIGPAHAPFEGSDAFVAKFDPAFTRPAWLTYLGGSCYDSANALTLDPAGNVWVAGITSSGDFPVVSPFLLGVGGAFVSELSPDGSRLLFSSFSDGYSLATDAKGSAYIAGTTSTSVIPKRTGAFGTTAVLDRIDPAPNPGVEIDSFVSVSTLPFALSSVAPGQLIRIQGHNLGPAAELDPPLDSTGRLPFAAANVSVMFDALPAPLTRVQESSIECFVPFGAKQSAQVTVTANGQKSNTVRIGITSQAPEILAVANQDGTANSAASPAAQGSVITVYVSGLGATNPPSVDGLVNASNAVMPLAPVSAYVGPFQTAPQFVGSAKGLIAGITQVNLLVPAGAYSSSASSLSVNGAASPFWVGQALSPARLDLALAGESACPLKIGPFADPRILRSAGRGALWAKLATGDCSRRGGTGGEFR